jgi:hypothetical protein
MSPRKKLEKKLQGNPWGRTEALRTTSLESALPPPPDKAPGEPAFRWGDPAGPAARRARLSHLQAVLAARLPQRAAPNQRWLRSTIMPCAPSPSLPPLLPSPFPRRGIRGSPPADFQFILCLAFTGLARID